MKKYTSLFLDVDNTLLDFYAAESYAIKKLFAKYGIDNSEKSVSLYSAVNKKYWQKYERGEMKKEEILIERFRETLLLLGEKRDAKSMNGDYFNLLSSTSILLDGAKELLYSLKQKGYLLYATTNGVAKTQYRRIKESGIERFLDGIFVSETAKACKPEKEYFDYAIEHSKEKDRSKILVIGDSMTSDIKGGINSGLDTCWFDGFGEEKLFEPTYTAKTLKEIDELL